MKKTEKGSEIMQHKFIVTASCYGQNKTLPGFNDYIAMYYRQRAKTKRDCQTVINNAIKRQLAAGLQIKNPVTLHFVYYEPDKRRDVDNIAGVAHKFIIDSLVQCGVLGGDGHKHVLGLSDVLHVDKSNPRIEVLILEQTGQASLERGLLHDGHAANHESIA